MKLCNFSNTKYHYDWYGSWDNLIDFLDKNDLDGIELLLHGNEDIEHIPNNLVKGLHLSYYPNWIPFYKGEDLKKDFPNESDILQAFGDKDPQILIEHYKREFEVAKKLNAKYMVFHVAHVDYEGAFTFEHDYNSKDVLDVTVDLVNNIFDEDSDVTLLFENLWWPGLTLTSKNELDDFMNRVNYKNKGVMLDLSHLLLMNKDITSLNMGCDYILDTIRNLEESKKHIQGIHINSTLAYNYFKEDHRLYYQDYKDAQGMDKFTIIYKHISSMDQHKPFDHHRLKEIIDFVNPKYKMIEVVGQDRNQWEDMIKTQLEYI